MAPTPSAPFLPNALPSPFSPAASEEEPREVTVPKYAPSPDDGDGVVARLVRLDIHGHEDGSIDISREKLRVGRECGGPLFSQDLYLSPQHATFNAEGGRVQVEDVGTINGIFLRIQSETRLLDGDVLRIGQELLRFETMPSVGSGQAPDGTRLQGSPEPDAWGRLVEVTTRDDHRDVHLLVGEEIVLGRSFGDIRFPEDSFVSSTHCRIQQANGVVQITDVGSSNGTYLRTRAKTVLDDGDLLLLGQQLFILQSA